VADDGIDDDHGEDEAKAELVMHDEVEARVQNHRLTCHHGTPAHDDERDVDPGDTHQLESLHQEPNRVGGDAPRSHDEAPKVKTASLLEGGEDDEAEFDHIVERQADEDNNGDEGEARRHAVFGDAIVACRHGGAGESKAPRGKKEKRWSSDFRVSCFFPESLDARGSYILACKTLRSRWRFRKEHILVN